jgi:hypothetical protein
MQQTERPGVRVLMSMNYFNLSIPSSLTTALGFTRHQTEMTTRRYFWGKERLAVKAENLTVIYEPIV